MITAVEARKRSRAQPLQDELDVLEKLILRSIDHWSNRVFYHKEISEEAKLELNQKGFAVKEEMYHNQPLICISW